MRTSNKVTLTRETTIAFSELCNSGETITLLTVTDDWIVKLWRFPVRTARWTFDLANHSPILLLPGFWLLTEVIP